jgi:hypothetical protein
MTKVFSFPILWYKKIGKFFQKKKKKKKVWYSWEKEINSKIHQKKIVKNNQWTWTWEQFIVLNLNSSQHIWMTLG